MGWTKVRFVLKLVAKYKAPKESPDTASVMGIGHDRGFLVMSTQHRTIILLTVEFFFFGNGRV